MDSIHSLYRHFLSGTTLKSLIAFHHACSHSEADYSRFMNVTASLVLKFIPDSLRSQSVSFCTDDTMISKFGGKFEDVSELFDHAAHNGPNYLNGHRSVNLMLYVPIWSNRRVIYLAILPGYRTRQRRQSKLEPVAAMVRQVMPSSASQKNVIILCSSWYAKKNLACTIDEYPNLNLICNARTDFVVYDLVPQPTGERSRPAKYGERLSVKEGLILSAEEMGNYYVGVRRVLTNIFGQREALAYTTSTGKVGDSERLFFGAIFPEQMQIFCVW